MGYAYEYILSKQIQWALNQGIELIGSEGYRGRPAYTRKLDENLFEPLTESAMDSFSQGDGNEVQGSPEKPAKMQALHSSSAIAVNIFQYWARINQVPAIAAACGLCRSGNLRSEKIVFEEKYPVDGIKRISPNIDVVIHNNEAFKFKRFAVECKFTEPFQKRGKKGIKPAYLANERLWEDIPGLQAFAAANSPENTAHQHLDSAQLIKHILGLKSYCNKEAFRLLYLYYDVPGDEGAHHRKEVEAFTEIAKADRVHFSSMSYQALIIKLARQYRPEHPAYVRYITGRYL